MKYPNKNEFIVFESEKYNCDGKITVLIKSKIYKPSDIENIFNILYKKKVQKV
ncbi:uncharacterized protein PgNI_12095 [Pyricularia grisea]|uniref:Uncharacterized protein n=1 Tax=Pyricularia grisea TaxID=148305 RepID=A0A6P8AQG8_PYRGI|nr:uncharacterized protein PgNI_12095 [Pyricularia grisea]TLD04284.1 hypothetical protein PgNI_12095 [Pyricularia grisea]